MQNLFSKSIVMSSVQTTKYNKKSLNVLSRKDKKEIKKQNDREEYKEFWAKQKAHETKINKHQIQITKEKYQKELEIEEAEKKFKSKIIKPKRRRIVKKKLEEEIYDAQVLLYRLAKEKEKLKSFTYDRYKRKYVLVNKRFSAFHVDLSEFNNIKVIYSEPNSKKINTKFKKLRDIIMKKCAVQDDKIYFDDIFNFGSPDIKMILITDGSKKEITDQVYDPMNDNLFSDIDNRAIYHKDITYELNAQAKKFGDMFNIQIGIQYVLDNYKANSCIPNLIVDTYKRSFDIVKKDGKRKYKELTYQYLCEIIGVELKHQDIGVSIRLLLAFFIKFRLGIDVVNVYGQLLFTYTPDNINKDLSPSRFRILVHNNHVYKLDDHARFKLSNLAKEFKLENTIVWDEVAQIQVSNKYHIRKPIEEDTEIHYIKKVDDCVGLIRTSKAEKIRFITTRDLTDMLFEMITQKYLPSINYSSGKIMSLSFKVGKFMTTIECSDVTAPDDTELILPNVESFKKYHMIDDVFYAKIIQENLKSEYSDSVIEIEDKYPIGPMTGYTNHYSEKTFNAIDMVKAYTDNLMQINEVPIFGYFDMYVKYDNHEIENLTMYIVECKASNTAEIILFPYLYNRCYGKKLKVAQKITINFKIIYFRRPHRIENVEYKAAVEEVYKSDLMIDEKKYIVNKTLGLAEKKFNKSHVCKVFYNLAEAQFYQIKYGGKMHSLCRELFDDNYSAKDDPLNYGIGNPLESNFKYSNYGTKKIYLVIVEKQEKLVDGFRQIKELIYDIQSIKLFHLYNDVVSKGIKPIGIKTDAILVDVKKEKKKLENLFKFNPDKIGGIKLEKGKILPNKKIEQIQNELIEIKEIKVNEVKIKDEYDTNEINQNFDKHNAILLNGLYPGVGKTSAVANYKGHKILFVTPFNKLAQELRKDKHNAETLNMTLGFYADGKEYANIKKLDISQYDCICFDEIKMYCPKRLNKIRNFMLNHPDKKFFGTGDSNQLQPMNFNSNNVPDTSEYLINCLNQMFPNQITLEINKRLKSEEDRNKLKQLKEEIFKNPKNIINILKKHNFNFCTSMKDVKTTENICYFNYRTNIVNNHVHTNLIKKPKKYVQIGKTNYWPGLELVCKERYTAKNVKLYVNYIYKIKSINDKVFSIIDEDTGDSFTLDIILMKHFSLPYANTCHSVQGLSIDGKITIFDVNTPYVDKYYIWTAITRARDLNNITIFLHSEEEVKKLCLSRIMQYFDQKVKSYKAQDKTANREWQNDDEYIDAKWIGEQKNKLSKQCCSVCFCNYEITLDENNIVRSNITVDRIDSAIAHKKSNCSLLCKTCNVTKSNRY